MSTFARNVREPSGNSPLPIRIEQIKILRDRPIAERAVLARCRQRAAIFANLIGVQIAHVGLSRLNQLHRPVVNLLEIITRVQRRWHVEPQPAHVFLDRLDVFLFLFDRIRVVESQIASAVVFDCQSKI